MRDWVGEAAGLEDLEDEDAGYGRNAAGDQGR